MAAALILNNVRQILIRHARGPMEVVSAIGPARGVLLAKELTRELDNRNINDFLQCLKSTPIASDHIVKIRAMCKRAYARRDILMLQRWVIWRSIIAHFAIWDFPFAQRANVVSVDGESFTRTPIGISALTFTDAESLGKANTYHGDLISL